MKNLFFIIADYFNKRKKPKSDLEMVVKGYEY